MKREANFDLLSLNQQRLCRVCFAVKSVLDHPPPLCQTSSVRGRYKLLVLAAVCLFLIAFTQALIREREPTYRGKTLAEWARQYHGEPTAEQAQEASVAIHRP
jgi:hypothetical protein